MTNKEAIEILRGVKSFFGRDCIPNETPQAIDMAISALKKQEQKKPLTNADRIRAMTDEELALFIMTTIVKEFRHHGMIGIFESSGYWLDWLKQEVSDGSPKD